MIPAFRLFKTKHLATAFSGEGARLHGGRWNSPSLPMIYTASSLSLATLEVLVHLEEREVLLRLFSWIAIGIPEALLEHAEGARLPPGWDSDEAGGGSRSAGDAWLRGGRSAALAVPSVVTPGEWNYLLNPRHPDFGKIRIGESRRFQPDPRLLR